MADEEEVSDALAPSLPALSPAQATQVAAVAIAVAGGLWHLNAAVELDGGAAPALRAGVALVGLGQLGWAVLVARRPTRAGYRAGALFAAALVAVSLAVVTRVPAAGVVPAVVGITAQLAWLQLALLGSGGSVRGRLAGARVALLAFVVTMSALVGGVTHAHGRAAAGPSRPAGQVAFLCHLL